MKETYQVKNGWIELINGTQFYFEAPEDYMIQVEEVAHALSMLCRFNGHTRRFYSVAEHACLMSDWVMTQNWATPQYGLLALHHDDAEYIIGDMARPVKMKVPQFKTLETTLDKAIAHRFGTEYPFPPWLKEIDRRILVDERRGVMNTSINEWGTDHLKPLGAKFWWILGRFPWVAKCRYLKRHRRLTAKLRASCGRG